MLNYYHTSVNPRSKRSGEDSLRVDFFLFYFISLRFYGKTNGFLEHCIFLSCLDFLNWIAENNILRYSSYLSIHSCILNFIEYLPHAKQHASHLEHKASLAWNPFILKELTVQENKTEVNATDCYKWLPLWEPRRRQEEAREALERRGTMLSLGVSVHPGAGMGRTPKKCCWGWIGELSTGSSGALSTQWGWGSQWQGGQQAEGPSWGALGAWMGIMGFMLDAKEPGRIVSRAVTKSLWLPRQSVLNRKVGGQEEGGITCFNEQPQWEPRGNPRGSGSVK